MTDEEQNNLEFTIDRETGTQVIRVIDSETGDLIRQVPSDQILHIISQVQELKEQVVPGVLLDDSV
jgi:flagellar protein FlaG